MKELSYLRDITIILIGKSQSLWAQDLIRADVEEKYNDSLMKLSKDDKFNEVKLAALKSEKKEN